MRTGFAEKLATAQNIQFCRTGADCGCLDSTLNSSKLKLPTSPHWWMPTSVLYLFLLLWTADSGATVVEFGAVLYTVAQAGSEAPKSSGTNEQLVRLSRHVRSLYGAESLATVQKPIVLIHCSGAPSRVSRLHGLDHGPRKLFLVGAYESSYVYFRLWIGCLFVLGFGRYLETRPR